MNQQPRYQIPTHLNVPDKIDLPLFGITVSLTMRQGICFLFGGSAIFNLWQRSLALIGFLGLLAHWIAPFLLACVTYIIAVHEFRGRHLEGWVVILLHYCTHTRVFVWCSVIGEIIPLQAPEPLEEEYANGVNDLGDEENEDG
jgi:hypothetical protein